MKKISFDRNIDNLIKNNKLKAKEKPKNDENFDNYDFSFNDVRQFIMKDMKNNNNKLKDVIVEHSGRNLTQENKSDNYFKNN